jgi:recombination protein RecA
MTITKTGSVRERPKLVTPVKSLYFTGEKPNISFVKSGCAVLDCALGGGYALGRITNIVGDKSTGKTSFATEAVINFFRGYPNGSAAYRETEAAFDKEYAAAMGMPVEKVDFADDEPLLTVEDFARDLNKYLEARIKDQKVGIYVLDSLDALSDEAEMEREFGKATYGMAKAKNLSEFFRRTARKLEQSRVLLLIVSQVRENVGITFGEKFRRAGGKSLDHYSSQILWLTATGSIKRTIKGVERVVGISIRGKVKKNKVGLALRGADFDFIFGFGIDDLGASVGWLQEVKRWPAGEKSAKEYLASVADLSEADYRREGSEMAKLVQQGWSEVETSFLPKRSKYG